MDKERIDRTINDLKKAISHAEYVSSNYCDDIKANTIKDAINFIVHLQLENERLQTIGNHHCQKCVFGIRESAKSEAINEFATRLKDRFKLCDEIFSRTIDNLAKEITDSAAMRGNMTDKTIQALERAIHLAEYVCSDYCDAVEITTIKNAVDIMKNQRLKIKEDEGK